MMKYPFTPAFLDSLPEELAELFRSLELALLSGICSRLDLADELNEVTMQNIRALRARGVDLDEIKKAIQQETGIGEQKLDELISDVVARNQTYYTSLIDLAALTQPEVLVGEAEIDAIRRQTLGEYRNITQSMGFVVDGGRTKLAPAKAYQWALDNAALQVESGTTSYNQAVSSAVRQLADSGLRVVSYESGKADQVDVAVRRAVMTGVSQLCDKYTVQSAEYLDTHYYEVSAHSGARDKPGPSPWSSHKDWQGKVYSERAGDIYPSIYEVCGLGEVDGLEGANCRHRRHPFIPGVSERTYTDEQLKHIDDGRDVTYDGKHYTAYEATQMQRRMENSIRKQKRRAMAFEKAGLKDDAQAANIKAQRLTKKYKEFSKAAKLPEQRARMKAAYTDAASEAEASATKAAQAKSAATNAKDDSDTLKFLGADARDDLSSIVKRRTIKLENGFSCFPDGDPLTENVKKVKPLKTYYDVALHGSSTAVGFGSQKTNMSPRLLASVIRHSDGWNGQNIRLLSCDTGKRDGDDYCFAEELANALGVKVKAPGGTLFVNARGEMYIGEIGDGVFITYKPNERRRIR